MLGPVVEIVSQAAPVDLARLRTISITGLSEYPPINRFYAWIFELGLIKGNVDDWENKKTRLFQKYTEAVKSCAISDWHQRSSPSMEFLPSGVPDEALMYMIHNDIVRTGRVLRALPPKRICDTAKEKEHSLFEYEEHVRRLERALYVFAKASGTEYGYLQGFNELIAPFYYVAATVNEDLDFCECISYRCFRKLITKFNLIEFFTGHGSHEAVLKALEYFTELQKKHLPHAYQLLESQSISPIYYAPRWFALLFAQEYELTDLLVLWDVLFARSDDLVGFLAHLAIAHMKTVEGNLSTSGYANNLMVLQNIEPNLNAVLEVANALYEQDKAEESKGWFRSLVEKLSFGYF